MGERDGLNRLRHCSICSRYIYNIFPLILNMKQKVYPKRHILQGDFELHEAVRKDLIQARAEPISKYLSHKMVIKEFL